MPARRALICLLLVAGLLRISAIGRESLWYDEALTYTTAGVPFPRVLASVRDLENTPPLYFYFINAWAHLFCRSDVSLRLPSAIFGTASVALMYSLVRRCAPKEFATRTGLCSAAFLALSRYHIAYSQQARCYSLLFLLCVCSCDRRRRVSIMYVLLSAAALWTHPFAGLVLAAQGIYLLCQLIGRLRTSGLLRTDSGPTGGTHTAADQSDSSNDDRPPFAPALLEEARHWSVLFGATLLLYWPWLHDLSQVYATGQPWIPMPSVATTLGQYCDNPFCETILCLLMVIGIVRAVPPRPSVFGSRLMATLLIIIPLTPILASTPYRVLFVARYGIAALMGIFWLSAIGAISLGRRAAAVALAMFCIGALPHLIIDLQLGKTAQQRADLKHLAIMLNNSARTGDRIFCTDFQQQRVLSAYLPRSDLLWLDALPADDRVNRIWLIDPDAPAQLLRGSPYRIVASRKFDGATLNELTVR